MARHAHTTSSKQTTARVRISTLQFITEMGICKGDDNSSSERNQAIQEIRTTGFLRKGICTGATLSDRGRRFQLIKILSLTLLPILCVWLFTVYSLRDSVTENDQKHTAKASMEFVIQLGLVLHRLQIERDMSVLYISALGTKTKTFLLNEYIKTDKAIHALTSWPNALKSSIEKAFRNKAALMNYVSQHRNSLDSRSSDLHGEIGFYSDIINTFLNWLIQSVQDAGFGSNWKTLVAYQKLTRGKEEVGVERAYGTLFYIQGRYKLWDDFETYNEKIYVFKYNYDSARFYSDLVAPLHEIETKNLQSSGKNVTDIIDGFRYELQYHKRNMSYQSLVKAQWLFDNMTTYLDTLLIIQQDVAELIMQQINEVIDEVMIDVGVYATMLVIVLLMCPLILLLVEALTSNIQRYMLTLVAKTKELNQEKEKSEGLLCQMIPKSVAENLKNSCQIEAEYFKSVTILFADIFDFTKMSKDIQPAELVEIVNRLQKVVGGTLDNYDVYKVQTLNDCHMIASGLPIRNGQRHVSEVAQLALDLLTLVKTETCFTTYNIHLRMGINSGSCMAGIVGINEVRYVLFGETVNVASRIKSRGMPDKIHLSERTYQLLKRTDRFETKLGGYVDIKGETRMKTYWLQGRKSSAEMDDSSSLDENIPGQMPYAPYEPAKGSGKASDDNASTTPVFNLNEQSNVTKSRQNSDGFDF